MYLTRIEEFAKDEIDLTLSTALEFNTPLAADLSDVKTMMDSINVVPGLTSKLHLQFTFHSVTVSVHYSWTLE